VIAQLDARLDLLGPAGRAGAIPAASMQLMHQAIYQILRDTGMFSAGHPLRRKLISAFAQLRG